MAFSVTPEAEEMATAAIAAAVAVHRELGPLLPESCYQLALARELHDLDIPFEREHPIDVRYKGHLVGSARIDFWIDRQLVLELKTVEVLDDAHRTQLLTYLKLTRCTLGLLMNFTSPVLIRGIKRIVHRPASSCPS
jgi:GxxExxY protein